MEKNKIYDIIFYLLMGSVLLWVIAKALGYINTSVLIWVWPYLGVIFGGGVAYQKLHSLEGAIGKIENKFESKFDKTENRFERIEKKVENIDKRLVKVETKLEKKD